LPAGRKFVCAALVAVLPTSLIADDSGAAILHHHGGTVVNGNPAPASIAIFPYDTVQTLNQHEATINVAGSAIIVEPDTLVQYQDDALTLDHGTVLVSTSRGLKVRVGCITVLPANTAWTQFDVTDIGGKVIVAARKNDVNIDTRNPRLQPGRAGGSQRATIREGEQATRDEHCGPGPKSSDPIAAKGAILNSPWAIGTALGGIVIGVCLIICHDDDPISPAMP
jgi:hypothetical protein